MPFASTDLQDKALAFVKKAFDVYSDRAGLEANWEKWDKQFNLIPGTKFYQGHANLFTPETRVACRSLVSFIDEAIYGTDPPFKAVGIGGPGDSKKAEVITALTIAQASQMKLRPKLRRMVWSIVKYGMGIVKVVWKVKGRHVIPDREQRKLLKKIIAGEPVEEKLQKKFVTVYDNVDFEVKDLRNIYFDPYLAWEDQVCIMERSFVSYEYLKNLEKQPDGSGVYYDIDRIRDETSKDPSGSKEPQNKQKKKEPYAHVSEVTGLSGNYDIGKNPYEVLEASCNFDIDGDGMDEECIITIVDRKWVIRLEANPYDIQLKPFLSTVWEEVEGTCVGQGVPQLAEKSQVALNDFVNQIMDNITQNLNNMWIVDDLAEIPSVQLKSRPNGVIRSKAGVAAVKAVEKQLTASEGLKAVAMCKDDIRAVSGATVSFQGLPAKYGTTLGEYSMQSQSSARDILAILREIEDRIIKPFLERAWSYDRQFMSREDFIRMVGREAAETTLGNETVAEAFSAAYDFIPQGVTQLENKVIKTQQYINFLNIVSKLPPGIVDLPKLVGKIWKPIGDGDPIVLPQVEAVLIAPEDENILLAQGEPVHAKPLENHGLHINVHQSGEITPLMQDHIGEHVMIMSQLSQSGGPPNTQGAPPQEQPQTTAPPAEGPRGPQGPPGEVPQPPSDEVMAGIGLRP